MENKSYLTGSPLFLRAKRLNLSSYNLLRDCLSCVQESPHCAYSTERLNTDPTGGCSFNEFEETRCGLSRKSPRAWIGDAGQGEVVVPLSATVVS